MNERELIQTISSLSASGNEESLLCGIGDDCAVVKSTPGQVSLYTMDTLIDSVHFDRNWHPPELLGRKAVSVNVSDIAAMGGQPEYLLFSLGLPAGFDEDWAARLCQGVVQACRQYGCRLIGGDTVRCPFGVTLTLAVIGSALDNQVLYRHGACSGDSIFVTGPLGLAAAGLELCRQGMKGEQEFEQLYAAHLDPRAKVDLGRILAASGLVNAMMDLSDGLATDLAHICNRSKLGARIFQDRLPMDERLNKAADILGQNPVKLMISGGEDYELLLTAPPAAAKMLQEEVAKSGHILYHVGKMVDGEGVFLVTDDAGNATAVEFLGFDHFSSS